jgi:hypothetical protein
LETLVVVSVETEVEGVDDVPVLPQRVGERPDRDEDQAGAENREELLLADRVAEGGQHAPEHHERRQHGFGIRGSGRGSYPLALRCMISTHAADDFSELLEDGPAVGFVSKSELSREAIRAMLAERGDRLASSL